MKHRFAIATHVALVLGATCGGCGGEGRGRTVAANETASESGGDLSGDDSAASHATSADNRGETGRPEQITLGARRERAGEVFNAFYDAVIRRDGAEVLRMLDATVYDLDSGDVASREATAHDIDELVARLDSSQLRAHLAAAHPLVRSPSETRHGPRAPHMVTTNDDWLVEWGVRGQSFYGVSSIPVRSALIRFVGDEPVIIGVAMVHRPYR